MADFKTIEYDIKQMLMGHHNDDDRERQHDTAKRIVTLAKNVAVHTLDMVNEKPRNVKNTKDRSIRMSELGEPCHRKLIFKWYHPEKGSPPFAEQPEPFMPVKFTFGDYIEELTLFLASEAGHSVSDRQKEVRLSGHDGWYAVGHIDAIIDGVVVDVKSAADVSFNKYKRDGLTEETDTFGYIWQLDAYATALGTANRAFLFTNKHDGNIHVIDRSHVPLVPVVGMIDTIGDTTEGYLLSNTLPAKIPPKVTKYGNQLGTICSYCAFKWSCYDGNIVGVIKSGRPMYFDKHSLTEEGNKLVKENTTIATPEAHKIPF